jgi:hypothetical protein
VGQLRRVMISNVVVYNADPRYASIISGIPDHDIEDVRFNNIRIYYKGGGTKEQAALDPPEKETDYPEPVIFVLNDVKRADFFRVKAQHAPDVPIFALTNVQDFSVQQSPPLSDTRIDRVKQKKL